jgi:hypothetical protein
MNRLGSDAAGCILTPWTASSMNTLVATAATYYVAHQLRDVSRPQLEDLEPHARESY